MRGQPGYCVPSEPGLADRGRGLAAPSLRIEPAQPQDVRLSIVSTVTMPKARLGYSMAAGVTMKSIARDVADWYGLTLSELMSVTRQHWVTAPRHEAMWLMRQVKNGAGDQRYSLPQIGKFFGGMHHTSILHGCRRHQWRLDNGKLWKRR